MPTLGSLVMPHRPGSSSTTRVRQPDPASSAKVVHCCPEAGTHCRSSAQIAQTSTFLECSTAQVAQIQKSTVSRLLDVQQIAQQAHTWMRGHWQREDQAE